ncbi:hypothetical protein [Streptomyces venezuelae]|nr:hypothetical protein [Streptomyces venezuelae]
MKLAKFAPMDSWLWIPEIVERPHTAAVRYRVLDGDPFYVKITD